MPIISRQEHRQLTLASKLAQFPEVLAACDAVASAGAAVKAAQAAKTAALVKVCCHDRSKCLSTIQAQFDQWAVSTLHFERVRRDPDLSPYPDRAMQSHIYQNPQHIYGARLESVHVTCSDFYPPPGTVSAGDLLSSVHNVDAHRAGCLSQVDHRQAAQQLAALQVRSVRSTERQWQLPDGCGTVAAPPEQIDWLVKGGVLEVCSPCHCIQLLTLHHEPVCHCSQ